MAARNPTAFTNLMQLDSLRAGKYIVETVPDDWHNDMEYILDAEQMAITDCHVLRLTQSTTYVEVARYHLKMKDMCGEVGISNDETAAKWSARVWSDGNLAIDIQVVSSGATTNGTSTNQVAATTSPTWSDFSHGALNIHTNNNEDTITVSIKREAGTAENVYYGGFALFVAET